VFYCFVSLFYISEAPPYLVKKHHLKNHLSQRWKEKPTVTDDSFNGLGLGLGNLSRLSNAKSRSISAENFSGEKGKGGMATEGTGKNCARDLGPGWKISPSIVIPPKSTFTLATIQGPVAIVH